MNKVKVLALFVALMILLPTAAMAKKIVRLNVSPLIPGGVKDVAGLKKVVEKYQARIQAGFAQAGAADLFPAFLEAVRNAPIAEMQVAKGQQLPWMLFYSNGKSKVLEGVEWDGRKAFDAFTVVVPGQCQDIRFVIPKVCGNVSLLEKKAAVPVCALAVSPTKTKAGEPVSVDVSGSTCADKVEVTVTRDGQTVSTQTLAGDITRTELRLDAGEYIVSAKALNADGVCSANECQQKLTIDPKLPPSCNLSVQPDKGYVGQVFKLDAGGSSDPDGKVVKAEFSVNGETQTVTEPPFVWETKIRKTGHYSFTAKVTDDDGLVSTNSCQVSPVDVQKRLYFVAEAGPMIAKGTYIGYLFGRLGLAYLIVPEKLDVLLTGGYAFKLGDSQRHQSHFLGNLLLIAHQKKFFAGAGLGYHGRVRDDWKAGLDVVGNIGYEMFRKFNMVGSLFGEARLPVQSGVEIKDAHELLLGFRLLF